MSKTFTDEQYADEYRMYARRPDWELRNVKKALSLVPALNSNQEDARLAAVVAILKERGKRK